MSYLPLATEPEHLTVEYHKARRQVMLWSGILIIWDILGIDLELAKNTEGTVGPIISAIKNTKSVPWTMLGLTSYFLVKLSIEWFQCSEVRRSKLAPRLDFWSAWVAGLMALVMSWWK